MKSARLQHGSVVSLWHTKHKSPDQSQVCATVLPFFTQTAVVSEEVPTPIYGGVRPNNGSFAVHWDQVTALNCKSVVLNYRAIVAQKTLNNKQFIDRCGDPKSARNRTFSHNGHSG